MNNIVNYVTEHWPDLIAMVAAIGGWLRADDASRAARIAVDKLSAAQSVELCSTALATISEIGRHVLGENWPATADRYNEVRRLIVELRVANPKLPFELNVELQDATTSSGAAAKQIYRQLLQKPPRRPNSMRLLETSVSISDTLVSLRNSLRNDLRIK